MHLQHAQGPESLCAQQTKWHTSPHGPQQVHHNAHAGIMVDGPKDMKPLVEAFAKQVCDLCLCPNASRKPASCEEGRIYACIDALLAVTSAAILLAVCSRKSHCILILPGATWVARQANTCSNVYWLRDTCSSVP